MERQALIDACKAQIEGTTNSRDNVAYFGGFTKVTGTVDPIDNGFNAWTACHSGAARYNAALYSSSQNKRLNYDHEATLAYYAWMFGPESPYRSILRDDIPHDPDYLADHGLIVVHEDDDIPANLFYNMVVAWRFPTEYPKFVKEWKRRVDLGVHPALAYLYIYVLPGAPNPNPNHQSFDWRRTSEEYVLNFMNGTPKTLTPSLKKGGSYRPSNAVWGDAEVGGQSGNSVASDNWFMSGWVERYPELCTPIQAMATHPNNPWGGPRVIPGKFTPSIRTVDNLVEILKLEGERLGSQGSEERNDEGE